MRDWARVEWFWTAFVVIVVPFGWLYPLFRVAIRRVPLR
jgi:hypothetical protein